ncbi:unnamed protein product, partial [Mesorhabditis spiculigera]
MEEGPASPDAEGPASPTEQCPASPSANRVETIEDVDMRPSSQIEVAAPRFSWPTANITRADPQEIIEQEKKTGYLARGLADNMALRDRFMEMVKGDVQALYRNRAVYANTSVKELTETPISVFQKIPMMRSSVIDYFGRLVHESAHSSFSRMEKAAYKSNNSLRNAIEEIFVTLQPSLLTINSCELYIEMLQSLCRVASELIGMNKDRPCFSHNKNPEDQYHTLRRAESVATFLKFVDFVIVQLANMDKAEEIIVSILRLEGPSIKLEWLWTHIVHNFTGTIVANIFSAGLHRFKNFFLKTYSANYLKGMRQRDFQVWHHAYVNLFNFISHKHKFRLREVVRIAYQDGLQSKLGENGFYEDFSLPFIFKLASSSPTVLHFILDSLKDLVTPVNVLKATQQLNTIPTTYILPEQR